jgi:hypothetical protein
MIDMNAAAELDHQLRAQIRSVADIIERAKGLIAQAKTSEIHVALGYRSWPEYFANVVGSEMGKLHIDDRRRIVEVLAVEGLSAPVIGDAVGVSHTTVLRDKAVIQARPEHPVPLPTTITSRDGSQRPAHRPPRPKPRPPTDEERAHAIAERIGERARGLAKACRDITALTDLTPEMAKWIPVLTFPAIDDMYDATSELYDWLDTVGDEGAPQPQSA